jgi:hypothetical protein
MRGLTTPSSSSSQQALSSSLESSKAVGGPSSSLQALNSSLGSQQLASSSRLNRLRLHGWHQQQLMQAL